MSAAPAPKTLTPDDLLALVRHSSGRFQRTDTIGSSPETNGTFRSRSYANKVDGSPEPQDTPQDTTLSEEAALTDVASQPSDPDPETQDYDAAFAASPEPRTIDLEQERQAAWDKGYAAAEAAHASQIQQITEQAEAAAKADAARDIEAVRDVFTQTVERLSALEGDRLNTLHTQMEATIRALAAERAGQRIDEAPKPFQRRIEKLMRDIAASVENTQVRLNPADLMAIRPHIKSFSPLADARLSPDTTLSRGDLKLVMDDITFADCMTPRSGGGLT